ncbi:YAP1-binding protein 1 [Rhinocladiella similis]
MTENSSQEDPLVAALPPATDYVTYLTLLEYQLTPAKLPTLNRLLTEDDGKLAEEIGWDLLRLVLPMLDSVPAAANQCLDIIARRGNPREVVVRVAEELEKLGDDTEDDNPDQDVDEDDMPTFSGEAPRVHLGSMKLDGMPDTEQMPKSEPEPVPDQAGKKTLAPWDKGLRLQALFNILGVVHPRIKTQYPSRFLATSLPPALGAYRHVPITVETTTSFLAMLENLSGKKRPPLPPRAGTADNPAGGADAGEQNQGVRATPASLPDPEAKVEEDGKGSKTPSAEENAIIFRLLNAVNLEVLDEYLSFLASADHPSMSWTARLRETFEPKRVLPGRPSQTQLWGDTPGLQERDALLGRFHKLATELSLNPSQELTKLVHDEDDADGSEEAKEEPSEYPTTPAQIPFPRNGIIFLFANEIFSKPIDAPLVLSTSDLTKLIAHAFPLSATPSIPSPALLDSLLSLLYRHAVPHSSPNPTPHPPPSPAKFLLLLSTLTQLFTITPWPALRDSAHYMASKLLHAYPDPDVRLQIITQTLRGDTLSTNWAETFEEDPDAQPGIDEGTGLTRSTSALQPHPIPLSPPQHSGALRAVGVDWLKDEFAAHIMHTSTLSSSSSSSGNSTASVGAGGLDPSILTSLGDGHESGTETHALLDLLFPRELPALTYPDFTVETLGAFLGDIPFYISTLNLLCIVLPHVHGAALDLNLRAAAHVANLSVPSKNLHELLQFFASQGRPSEVLEASRADIAALNDATARATKVLERTTEAA